MAWKTPKTDWVSTEYINLHDYERIRKNIEYLEEKVGELYPLPSFEVMDEGSNESFLMYARRLMAIEKNVEYLSATAKHENSFYREIFSSNGKSIDYLELNRIENMILELKTYVENQLDCKRVLSFRLGGRKCFGKRIANVRPDIDYVAYRCEFRLGTKKGGNF